MIDAYKIRFQCDLVYRDKLKLINLEFKSNIILAYILLLVVFLKLIRTKKNVLSTIEENVVQYLSDPVVPVIPNYVRTIFTVS